MAGYQEVDATFGGSARNDVESGAEFASLEEPPCCQWNSVNMGAAMTNSVCNSGRDCYETTWASYGQLQGHRHGRPCRTAAPEASARAHGSAAAADNRGAATRRGRRPGPRRQARAACANRLSERCAGAVPRTGGLRGRWSDRRSRTSTGTGCAAACKTTPGRSQAERNPTRRPGCTPETDDDPAQAPKDTAAAEGAKRGER